MRPIRCQTKLDGLDRIRKIIDRHRRRQFPFESIVELRSLDNSGIDVREIDRVRVVIGRLGPLAVGRNWRVRRSRMVVAVMSVVSVMVVSLVRNYGTQMNVGPRFVMATGPRSTVTARDCGELREQQAEYECAGQE